LALFGLIQVDSSDARRLCDAFDITLDELEETVDAALESYLITDRYFVRLAPSALVGAVIDGSLERYLISARHAVQRLPDELVFRAFRQLRAASGPGAAMISQDLLERYECASVPLGQRGIDDVLSTINNWSCVYHLNSHWVLDQLDRLAQRVAELYSEGSPSDGFLQGLKHLLFADFGDLLQQIGPTSSGFEVVLTTVFRLVDRLPDYPTQGLATRLLSPGAPHEMAFPDRLGILNRVALEHGYSACSRALQWLNTDLNYAPGRQVIELMRQKIAPADACMVVGFAVDLGEQNEMLLTNVAFVVGRHLAVALNVPTVTTLLSRIAELRWPSAARPLIVAALGLAREFSPPSVRDAVDHAAAAIGPLSTADVFALTDQYSWSAVVGGDSHRSEQLCKACAKALMDDSTGVGSFLDWLRDNGNSCALAPAIAFEIGILDSAGHWRTAFADSDDWMISRAYLDGLSRPSQPED
jgi:hypothetical protein